MMIEVARKPYATVAMCMAVPMAPSKSPLAHHDTKENTGSAAYKRFRDIRNESERNSLTELE